MTAPAFRSAGTYASSASANITPGMPAGYAVGDLLVLFFENDVGTAGLSAAAEADGWEMLVQGNGPTSGAYLNVATRRVTSTPVTAPVVNRNGGDHVSGIIHAYSGVGDFEVQDLPFGYLGGSWDSAVVFDETTPSAPQSDILVCQIVVMSQDSSSSNVSGWANSTLSGLTERSDNANSDGNGGGLAIATGVLLSPYTLGETTATLSISQIYSCVSLFFYPDSPPISGSGAITLGSVSSSASATLSLSAQGAPSLGAVSTSAAGTLSLSGAGSAQIGALSSTASGALALAGAASIVLGAIAAGGTGGVDLAGAAGIALADITSQSTGALAIVGEGAIALDPVLGYGEGEGQTSDIIGEGEGHLDPVTLAASGQLPLAASASITLPPVTSEANAALTLLGAGNARVGDILASGTAGVALSGTGQAVLGDLVAAGAGTIDITAEALAQVGAILSAGDGTLSINGEGAASIGPVRLVARGRVPVPMVTPASRIVALPGSTFAQRTSSLAGSTFTQRTVALKP